MFRRAVSPERQAYLKLIGGIESRLRDLYAERYEQKLETLDTLANKLNVSRRTVRRRLTGRTSMDIKTLSDMARAMDCRLDIEFIPEKELVPK